MPRAEIAFEITDSVDNDLIFVGFLTVQDSVVLLLGRQENAYAGFDCLVANGHRQVGTFRFPVPPGRGVMPQ